MYETQMHLRVHAYVDIFRYTMNFRLNHQWFKKFYD